MRTLRNSKIYFDNSTGVNRPGDILTGRVEINFNSSKVVRGIFYEIIGKASVYWTESESTTNSDGSTASSSTTYSNKETYFREKVYVVGKEKSDATTELPRGQYVYPFKYQLPDNLPPSFTGRDGKIIYIVRATLVRPWKIDKRVEAQFTVDALSFIEKHPLAKEPGILTMEKQFGIIFKSKPLQVIVRTPHSGFVPGQIIPLTVQVKNNSNTAVNSIALKFKELRTFYATSKDSKQAITLSKTPIHCQIKPNSFTSFNHSIKVPDDVILHDLSNCKIIDVDYEIRVELRTAGLTTNLVGGIPLYPIKTA